MTVTVPINFVGQPPAARWFPEIRAVWNHFAIVNTSTGERIILTFVPQVSSSGFTVTVVGGPAQRANESTWYPGDARSTTAPHEFGHMLGLQDEYQVTREHYEGITGQEAPHGATRGAGAEPADVARDLHTEITTPGADQPARIHNVITTNSITQGDYAQMVMEQYAADYGPLVPALVSVQRGVADPDLHLYYTIEAFSYTSGSIMGGTNPIDHDHGAEPRHVRRFAQIVQQSYGGNWRPEVAY
jgi:hypothetical protein